MILTRKFYQKSTLEVAQNILGCFLIRKIGNKIIKGVIIETEAYIGEDDLASHASKGRTTRTEIMYGEAGHAYVYMIYGMYHCLNIVTEKKDFPAAILIRGIKIKDVDYKKTNGPGKICKFLKIDQKINDWDITKKDKLWIASSRLVCIGQKSYKKIPKNKIHKDKRIGIDYAKHCKEYLWRFHINSK